MDGNIIKNLNGLSQKTHQRLVDTNCYAYYRDKTLIIQVPVIVSKDGLTCSFECPFCYRRYNKNGEPGAKAKRMIHTHGWGKGEDKTLRIPHCCDQGKEYWELPRHYQFELSEQMFRVNLNI